MEDIEIIRLGLQGIKIMPLHKEKAVPVRRKRALSRDNVRKRRTRKAA